MKNITIFLSTILLFTCSVKCQINDTVPGKIVWVKNLKECLLVGVIPFCNPNDTFVVISPATVNNDYLRGGKKMEIGHTYIFIAEKEIPIGSPVRKMSVIFKNTVVWTNKEPKNLKPKICLNCVGEYID